MAPRELTPEARARVGLPAFRGRPYPWAFAALVAGVTVVPLALAKLWFLAIAVIAVALAVLPWLRWHDRREHELRDRVYREGDESVARVSAVEPPGPSRADGVVRVTFFAGKAPVSASIRGCPLARRGLGPGDDVVVIYDRNDPKRCLIAEKVKRERA